ncbi:helix-turn-helix domain-containing protein [Sphingomonas sp. UYP23]
MTITIEPLADPVPVAAGRLSICRAQLYKEIAAGRIVARKAGKRTLIERSEQARWLSALPLMPANIGKTA